MRSVSALLFAAVLLAAPAGTHLQIRLTTKLSSQTAKAKDPVEAVVVAPLVIDGQFIVPSGAIVRGTVESAASASKADERSALKLTFTELEFEGTKHKIAARVSSVDNARESIDDKGQINGILASETLSGRLDSGLGKLAEKASGFAGVLATVKKAVLNATDTEIVYEAGTDLEIELTAPLDVKASTPGIAAKLVPIADDEALYTFVNRQPFRTAAENPPKPSDVTNIMLVGTQEAVVQAFKEAGWSSAAALSTDTKLETFRAIAEQRGYKEAPVSILRLDGAPPDLVFEKLTNTFAQRHHLRVWRRHDEFEGMPVWLVAATHDTGIEFSEQNRTFIHKIDGAIDRERSKVVNDLLFTGHVRSVALVQRPDVPKSGQNATGDNVTTDAAMAVLVLQ